MRVICCDLKRLRLVICRIMIGVKDWVNCEISGMIKCSMYVLKEVLKNINMVWLDKDLNKIENVCFVV